MSPPEKRLLLMSFDRVNPKSWLVHTETAVGLCRFPPGQVIPEMKKLRKDAREYVRNNARWVILRIKEQGK